MYEYLDRTPPELPMQARLAHMSLRLWAKDVRASRCPMNMQRELFSKFGAPGALWPAHNFYAWTFAHAVRPMTIGCPCCGAVCDDEALLLTAIMTKDPVQARACLRSVLSADAVERAVRGANELGSEFRMIEWPNWRANSTMH